MDKIKHRDLDITLEANGKFSAIVNGERRTKSSLSALKSDINKILDSGFEPFIGVRHNNLANFRERKGFYKLNIIKHQPANPTRGWSTRHPYYIADNGCKFSKVILDTEKNRKLLLEIAAHDEESRKISQKRSEQEAALHEKLEVRKAEDYVPPAPAKK